MQITPLSAALGAEVRGVDLRQLSDGGVFREVRAAWDTHHLLLFRDQALGEEDQVRLMERWGPVLVENERGTKCQYVSNAREDGILQEGAYSFHSDHAFMPDPVEAISLYGLEIPSAGAQTLFANAARARETLSEALSARVAGLEARHIIDPLGDPASVRVRDRRLPPELPHAMHPIVWAPPHQRRSVLYVNQQQTDRIIGLAKEDSDALLEELFAHLYRAEHLYEHVWRPGDLLVWDNLALQHARPDFLSDEPRTLRRVAVGGSPVWTYFAAPSPMGSRHASDREQRAGPGRTGRDAKCAASE